MKQKAKEAEIVKKAEVKAQKEIEKATAKAEKAKEKVAAMQVEKTKLKAKEAVTAEGAKLEDDKAVVGAHCVAMVVLTYSVPPLTLVLCEFARPPFMSRAAMHTLGTSPGGEARRCKASRFVLTRHVARSCGRRGSCGYSS